MATYSISQNQEHLSSNLFKDCEHAFLLIKEGKEKQAEEEFPLEFYLIKKYLDSDLNSLSKLLKERLSINK